MEKALLFLALVGCIAAMRVVPGDEYNVQLWTMNSAKTAGIPLHPYNVFTFMPNQSQSAGDLHFSTTDSRLRKMDDYYYDTSVQRWILEVTLYTEDGTDMFARAVPIADVAYGMDMYFFVGFSGNNMSASNPINFELLPNEGYPLVDKIRIDTQVYNDHPGFFDAKYYRVSSFPELGAIYYIQNAYSQGINKISMKFYIKPNILPEGTGSSLPTAATTGAILESFCDTLDGSCGLCSSHPRCVWCMWNTTGEETGTCLMSTSEFVNSRCLSVGGQLLDRQCKLADPSSSAPTYPPESTFISESRPNIPSTTGRKIPNDPESPPSGLRTQDVIAISFSIMGAFLIVGLIIGGVFLCRNKSKNTESVELATKNVQI